MRKAKGLAESIGYRVTPEVEEILTAITVKNLDIWEREIGKSSLEGVMVLMSDNFRKAVVTGPIANGLIDLIGPNLRRKQEAVAKVQPALALAWKTMKDMSEGKQPTIAQFVDIMECLQFALCSGDELDIANSAGLYCPECSPSGKSYACTKIVPVGDCFMCTRCGFEAKDSEFKTIFKRD